MSFLRTQHILVTAANIYRDQNSIFSKSDIQKNLHEIKFLVAQKKIPKLTLRKEVIHLEDRLHGVFELEKQLRKNKMKESAKIIAFKKEIKYLKNKLTTAQDPQLKKKVERLSNLLAETMAREDTDKKIKESELELHDLPKIDELAQKATQLQFLQHRLTAMKHELELDKELGISDPVKIKSVEDKIKLFEIKVQQFISPKMKMPEPPTTPKEMLPPQPQRSLDQVKHTMLIGSPSEGKPLQEVLGIKPPQPLRDE
ncbi:hypothetical protein J4444_00565 [Candidatus Woesearchaeota archaeon]|nr:hypothetical protein [Candidatus Woesearchaeota archaeon]